MWRVDLFRRFLAADDDGSGGKCVRRANDMIQFYGLRATRTYDDSGREIGWAVDRRVRLHTVAIVKLGMKVKK